MQQQKNSLMQVTKWISELRGFGGEDIVLVIAGNKCDKESERQIKLEEAENYAIKNGAKHFSTSAKSSTGLHEMFSYLAKAIIEKNKSKGESQKKRTLLVGSDSGSGNKKGKKKGGDSCCQFGIFFLKNICLKRYLYFLSVCFAVKVLCTDQLILQ
eukprot:TRINITY_DN11073_c0_g1_i6.p2 TRINITY_DN11073_c0_g1~~TRINITY_DN11073_c0_g1_i6.p2  ORF type:complete len:156 (+),score=20.09 TRINITY_DN11073_c0_g1_i6:111-578(+)